jgi:hypothetical protein
MLRNAWVTERLAASEEGLSSIESVILLVNNIADVTAWASKDKSKE